jgi:hypothetical protein
VQGERWKWEGFFYAKIRVIDMLIYYDIDQDYKHNKRDYFYQIPICLFVLEVFFKEQKYIGIEDEGT